MRLYRARTILAALTVLASAGYAEASSLYKWVQYASTGLEARAITSDKTCPAMAIDGTAVEMSVRATPGEDYPITVCSAQIPATAKKVTIDRVPLPLPKAEPNRILLIGDTGCRLKGKEVQACNDSVMWPFRTNSDVGSQMKPDLIIDVGDYHYRETECPDGNEGCEGSPFGDNWDVWREDFFSPASLLLQSAPWIMVRGNHEECERGGKGWARTLDPYAWSADAGKTGCLGPAQPFVVKLPGVSVVVMDVSTASDKPNEKQIAFFKKQFADIATLAPEGPVWVAFHRPLWTVSGKDPKTGDYFGDNQTLQQAALGTLPANVQMLLSGHQHKFEVDAYEQDLPVQIVSGHGGDNLDEDPPTNPVGMDIRGVKIKSGFAKPRTFGFSMLERAPGDRSGRWTLTDYDVHGQPLGACELFGRTATCK